MFGSMGGAVNGGVHGGVRGVAPGWLQVLEAQARSG